MQQVLMMEIRGVEHLKEMKTDLVTVFSLKSGGSCEAVQGGSVIDEFCSSEHVRKRRFAQSRVSITITNLSE